MTAVATQCQVCRHRLREEIELAIVSGEAHTRIAKRHGVGRMSVGNHERTHLRDRLRREAEAAGALTEGGEPSLWLKLSRMEDDLLKMQKKAEREGQTATAINALKERRSIAERKAEIRGEIAAPSSAHGGTTVVVLDAAAADRALKTWSERRGLAPGNSPQLPEPIDTETAGGTQ
jgi:hypothetical protein